jgi:hypothetical protein
MSPEAYVGPHGGVLGAWVTECSQRKPKWKHALAHHTATHLIQYGDVIQLGSGTTFNGLMEKIIELQESRKKAYDLIILTTNLQVLKHAIRCSAPCRSFLREAPFKCHWRALRENTLLKVFDTRSFTRAQYFSEQLG